MEQVCAVVVTYNRRPLLRQCLDALREQSHPLASIVVVDNASTDGTREMVEEEYPEVDLVTLAENRGGAGGFYAGMKRALQDEVEWIWVMDDDAEPAPDALEQLFAPGLQHEPDTVALTSLKVLPNGCPQYDQTGWYAPVEMKITSVDPSPEPFTEIEYGSFVGLLVRSTVIEHVGFPDPGYFLWFDDVEYGLRLAQVGRLYLVRPSRIVHHTTNATHDVTEAKNLWRNRALDYFWRYYYRHRNRMLIVRKHVSSPLRRWRGYLRGVYCVLRRMGSTLLYDKTNRGARLWLIAKSYLHGLLGRKGKLVDPAHYSSTDDSVDSASTEKSRKAHHES